MSNKHTIARITGCLSSEAGQCLTPNDWQHTGIDVFSCRLDKLLMKPGLSFLQQKDRFNHYFPIYLPAVLNASYFSFNAKKAIFTTRCDHNGTLIELTLTALIDIINQFNLKQVLMPRGIGQYYRQLKLQLCQTITPYLMMGDLETLADDHLLPPLAYQSYLPIEHLSIADIVNQLQTNQTITLLTGDIDYVKLRQLMLQLDRLNKNVLILNDKPGQDGIKGIIYDVDKSFNVLDPVMKAQHICLSPSCYCSACQQGLTRAYFNHLLQHTPLLAQRFLIQHNLFMVRAHTLFV